MEEEGLENAWQRHNNNHMLLRAGIEAMGLSFIVSEKDRLPQLNSISVPDGVDEALVRKQLLENFSLEIGAGLGSLAGKVWRIGLMGYASNIKNIAYCLSSLDVVLTGMGADINSGEAIKAMQKKLLEM